jgi:hypothetical protein
MKKPKASPPDVSVRVMQPEDAPGGLIAEIHMSGEPIGPALEMLSGPAFNNGIRESAAAGTGQAQDAGLVEDPSYPPYISFITFNRLGLTIRNLTIFWIPMKTLSSTSSTATQRTTAGTIFRA